MQCHHLQKGEMHRRIECALSPWHDTCCACSCLDVGLMAALLPPRSNFCHGKVMTGWQVQLAFAAAYRLFRSIYRSVRWPSCCSTIGSPYSAGVAIASANIAGHAGGCALRECAAACRPLCGRLDTGKTRRLLCGQCGGGGAAAEALPHSSMSTAMPYRMAESSSLLYWYSEESCRAYIGMRSLFHRPGKNKATRRRSLSMALTSSEARLAQV